MKTAILYYSFSGYTGKIAKQMAAERDADLFEVKEAKKRGALSAYFHGCPQAMKQFRPEIDPTGCDFTSYDTFILAAPVWAGYPAPAFNSILALLPEGAEVEVVLTSASGISKNGRPKVEKSIEAKGCRLKSYTDIKKQ